MSTLINYTAQTFTNLTEIFDYLKSNVPWWDDTSNDKLTKDNITVEITGSSSNQLLITETQGGQTLTSSTFTTATATVNILITDDAIGIAHKSGSNTYYEGIIIGEAIGGGTGTSWGAIIKNESTSGSTGYAKMLTYGALSADTIPIGGMAQSVVNSQLVPVYATQTNWRIKNAFMIIMMNNPDWNGKVKINDGQLGRYLKCGGLALLYTDT